MTGGALHGAESKDGRPSGLPHRRFRRLRPGDRVAVLAPSGPVDPGRLQAGCAVLRDLGLEPVVGKHALDRDGDGLRYLAGADAERAADLTAAWCDPDIHGVLCARGGYGATRLLDHLDWAELAAAGTGKPLHGSSDVTALHAAFGRRLGVSTSFGPMVGTLPAHPPPETVAHLRAALFGEPAPVTGTHAITSGRASGTLTGGTLSLLASMLGTPYAPESAAGRIAFLEDVTESPYRIDRMLTQLLQAGWFHGVTGVALGSWVECGPPEELDAVFRDRLGPLGVPILAGLPAGHGPRQLTVELGAPYVLDTAALTLRQGGAV